MSGQRHIKAMLHMHSIADSQLVLQHSISAGHLFPIRRLETPVANGCSNLPYYDTDPDREHAPNSDPDHKVV